MARQLFPFLFSIILFSFLSCSETNHEQNTPPIKKSLSLDSSTFIGEQQCKTCHSQEFEAWQDSHHDLAMQIADSITVLGNFKDISFESNGIKYDFFKKGKDFYVNTRGENNAYHDYKITYTFGVEPLQQYLVEFPKGQYQCLQAAWDTKKNTWFDLQPTLKINGKSLTPKCHYISFAKSYFLLLTSAKFGVRSGLSTLI